MVYYTEPRLVYVSTKTNTINFIIIVKLKVNIINMTLQQKERNYIFNNLIFIKQVAKVKLIFIVHT